jgi:hypothetical protein
MNEIEARYTIKAVTSNYNRWKKFFYLVLETHSFEPISNVFGVSSPQKKGILKHYFRKPKHCSDRSVHANGVMNFF